MSLFILLYSFNVQSQIIQCGVDGLISDTEIKNYLKIKTEMQQKTMGDRSFVATSLPIHFTIVRTSSDCQNFEDDIELIQNIKSRVSAINQNANFPNITFYITGIKFVYDVNNTVGTLEPLNKLINKPRQLALFNLYNVQNAINVYIYRHTTYSYAKLPISLDNFQDGITNANLIVLNGLTSELEHELGHYFGLFHTHETALGVERVIRPNDPVGTKQASNCSTAGDTFCDTPADPGTSVCTGGCTQTCTAKDINMDTYNPNKQNIMGYYYCSPGVFSIGQKNFMTNILNTDNSRSFLKTAATSVIDYRNGDIRTSPCFDFDFINDMFEFDRPMKGVTVKLAGTNNFLLTTKTSICGAYHSNPPLGVVTIKPEKNDDIGNGLNDDATILNGPKASDCAAITKHVLATKLLPSSYQKIAADVNKSGTITTADIVAIRKVVLNLATTFPNNVPSWRFLPKLHEKSVTNFNLVNPFTFSYNQKYYNASSANDSYLDVIKLDLSQSIAQDPYNWGFTGIKMGDVYCNYTLPAFKGNATSRENLVNLSNVPTINDIKGEATVNITLSGIEELESYQLALKYDSDAMQIVDVQFGDYMNAENSTEFYNIDRDILKIMWYDENGQAIKISKKLGLLKIRVRKLQDSEEPIFSIAEKNMKSLFFSKDNTMESVDLNIDLDKEQPVLKDTRNTIKVTSFPNPITAEFANLVINLPNESDIRIVVFDKFGNIVRTLSSKGVKGMNNVTIDKLDDYNGFLYYRVSANNQDVSGKVMMSKY